MVEDHSTIETLPPHILELTRISRVKTDTLLAHAKSVYSREGIDGIIEYIFSVIGTKNKQAVDFGAMDGKRGSNTLNLVRHHGWHSLMIEGNANYFQALQKTAEEEKGKIKAVHGCVGITMYPKLDTYVSACPKDLDLMSIDIDGMDYFVWESLSSIKPRVIIIEYNFFISPDVLFVQAMDERIQEGASAAALVDLGKKKGYSLVAVTKSNLIFVLDEEFEKLGLKNNSLEALWMRPFRGRIFTCENGKIYTVGLDRVQKIFKDCPIEHDTLQLVDFAKKDYTDYLGSPLDVDMANMFIKRRSRIFRLYEKTIKGMTKVFGMSK